MSDESYSSVESLRRSSCFVDDRLLGGAVLSTSFVNDEMDDL